MWLPNKAFDLFRISHDTTTTLREELSAIKVERDSLSKQLTTSQVMNDWLRMRCNGLEMERTALLEKAYNIRIPTPELTRVPVMGETTAQQDFSFEDVGDVLAKKWGMPVYGDKQ